MSKHLTDVLLEYYQYVSKKEDFSQNDFIFGGKNPLAYATIDRNKNKYFEKSGVPK